MRIALLLIVLLVAAPAFSQRVRGGATTERGDGVNVDTNGDTKFNIIYADQDWDGDGTVWKTCDCGGETRVGWTAGYICGTWFTSETDRTLTDYSADPDRAVGPLTADDPANPSVCRFHGERVWDDLHDDLVAMRARVGPGATVYFPPGTYDWGIGHRAGADANSILGILYLVQRDGHHFRDDAYYSGLVRSGTWFIMDNGTGQHNVHNVGRVVIGDDPDAWRPPLSHMDD